MENKNNNYLMLKEHIYLKNYINCQNLLSTILIEFIEGTREKILNDRKIMLNIYREKITKKTFKLSNIIYGIAGSREDKFNFIKHVFDYMTFDYTEKETHDFYKTLIKIKQHEPNKSRERVSILKYQLGILQIQLFLLSTQRQLNKEKEIEIFDSFAYQILSNAQNIGMFIDE